MRLVINLEIYRKYKSLYSGIFQNRGPLYFVFQRLVNRMHSGHAVPLSYGGHAVPSAGTQCLSRLRRSLRKQTEKSLFSAPYGKALQKQSKNLHKGNHRSPTTCEKGTNKMTDGPNPGNSPGVGASLLRGKLPSLFVFYFRLANGYRAMDA